MKIAFGQRYDYKTGCLLDYPYFRQNYELIAIDLKQALDADQKEIKQNNFTKNPQLFT